MRVLGIDPGSRRCGFGVVEVVGGKIQLVGAGVIKLTQAPLPTQLRELRDGLREVLKKYPADRVAVEELFFAYNPQSVLKLAQFRGAILMELLDHFPTIDSYTPLQVKRALTGNGKAKKEQVAFVVRQLLGIKTEIKPLDITDALAIAITLAREKG